MRFEIDYRSTDLQSENLSKHTPFFGIRIYPENNREMAEMECAMIDVKGMERITNTKDFHYLICLPERK